MKKLESKKFIIILFCILLTTTIFIIKNMKGTRATEIELLFNQTVDNLEFLNAKLENGKLIVEVHNTLSTTYNLKTIEVSYYDNSNNIITTVKGYIGPSIDSDNYRKLIVQTDADLSNATKIEYTINK